MLIGWIVSLRREALGTTVDYKHADDTAIEHPHSFWPTIKMFSANVLRCWVLNWLDSTLLTRGLDEGIRPFRNTIIVDLPPHACLPPPTRQVWITKSPFSRTKLHTFSIENDNNLYEWCVSGHWSHTKWYMNPFVFNTIWCCNASEPFLLFLLSIHIRPSICRFGQCF